MKRLARVLVLLPGADIGGAEVHTAWLARFFAASGLDLRLAIAPPLRDRFAGLLGPDLAARLEAAPIAFPSGENAGSKAAPLNSARVSVRRVWPELSSFMT